MRLYRIESGGEFVEYAEQPFQIEHLEETLEAWLQKNPDALIEEGRHLIIGRQVRTNLDTYIDLLGLARDGDLVVVELKRAETPRTTVAQVLEYASFTAGLGYADLEALFRTYMGDAEVGLLEAHREYFQLSADEAVAFNKRQRMVIVGSSITPQIRQTALYLRRAGLPVTCVEFDYFKTASDEQLLSIDLVVGREPVSSLTVSNPPPRVTESSFLAAVGVGRGLFEKVIDLHRTESLPINWGTKGFSINVEVGGQLVVLAYGYPPGTFSKGLYTDFASLRRKVNQGEQLAETMRARLERDPLWGPAGREMKCVVSREFSDQEIVGVMGYLTDLRAAIVEQGLAVAFGQESESTE